MKLHELRLKSDKFTANIEQRIEESILFAENQIVDLNREQMKNRQVDSKDNDMPEYSSKWKSIKGLTYWNLFQKGNFHRAMFLSVKYPSYEISTRDRKLPKILALAAFKLNGTIEAAKNKIFGIAPSNRDKAKQITTKAFAQKYKSQVFGK